jgi:Ni/Fe-hydrogenase subunit HybB-like protein
MKIEMPKITFWRVVFAAIVAVGLYATWIRFTQGLGASTNLSDEFPWGLWIGFDVLCGVMLAAGGFTLMATVNIFHAERFRPIVRPALLTAFLGYLLVVVALLFDLGLPYRLWHPLVMWNPSSVMFEVAWCVTLYTTVLALEFAPVVFEKLRMEKPRRILHMISIPLVIAGVVLSTLHQSSLGSLYLIMPDKLHPLWYSPMLPLFFFISAIAVGIAMTIFESSLSSKHLGHRLEPSLIFQLSRIMTVLLVFYGVLRFQDLYRRDAMVHAFTFGYESTLFLAEIGLGLFIPLALLMVPKIRTSTKGLYLVSVLVVTGFVVNRLNVSITGLEGWVGGIYLPKWTEVAITVFIVAVGAALFGLAAKYLPIFEEPAEEAPEPVTRLPVHRPIAVEPVV